MTSFPPIDSNIIQSSFILYSKVMMVMMGLVSLLFIIRISLLVTKIAGPFEYGQLIQDTVTFLGLNYLFPKFITLIVSVITKLSQQIAFISNEKAKNVYIEFMDHIFSSNLLLSIMGKIGPLMIQGLSYSIYSVLISLLLAAAPIFMLLGTMLGMTNGIKTYFGLIISFCLWPVLWNLLGQLGNTISSQHTDSPLTTFCFFITINILQLLSPLISYSLFKSMSVSGGTLTKTAGKVISLGRT